MPATLPITAQDWQPQLGAEAIVAGLDDIAQCIRIILETPKAALVKKVVASS
jgi:phage baseplate assembly protein W